MRMVSQGKSYLLWAFSSAIQRSLLNGKGPFSEKRSRFKIQKKIGLMIGSSIFSNLVWSGGHLYLISKMHRQVECFSLCDLSFNLSPFLWRFHFFFSLCDLFLSFSQYLSFSVAVLTLLSAYSLSVYHIFSIHYQSTNRWQRATLLTFWWAIPSRTYCERDQPSLKAGQPSKVSSGKGIFLAFHPGWHSSPIEISFRTLPLPLWSYWWPR